jgi:membrane-associated phospholipid phosphatase
MNTKKIALLSVGLFASFFLDDIISKNIAYLNLPFLESIMRWFSHEITVFVVLVMISALFLYEERKNKFIPILFMSFLAALVLTYALKFMIMRPRPFGINYIDLSFLGTAFKFIDYSFPSTHSALAFSVLPILDKEFKKLKVFWIFFSCMVALSRIYLNQHFLSDVLAGCILGYMIGHYIIKLGEKHGIHKILHEL